MPATTVRVAGSGFTSLNFQGQRLLYLRAFTDSGQMPGTDPVAITPLGKRHPVEIVTPRYLRMGTLTFQLWEKWDSPAWWQLPGLEGTEDIISLFERLADRPDDVTVQMIISPPNNRPTRGKTYYGVIITGIDDGENVNIASMDVSRTVTAYYTHATALRQG